MNRNTRNIQTTPSVETQKEELANLAAIQADEQRIAKQEKLDRLNAELAAITAIEITAKQPKANAKKALPDFTVMTDAQIVSFLANPRGSRKSSQMDSASRSAAGFKAAQTKGPEARSLAAYKANETKRLREQAAIESAAAVLRARKEAEIAAL